MNTLTDIQSYIKTIKIKTFAGIITPTFNSPQLSWVCNWVNQLSTVDVTSRQIGGTVAQELYASYIATVESNSNILIRSHNMATSRYMMFAIRCILESNGTRFATKTNNTLELQNGSILTTQYDPDIYYRLVCLDQLGYTTNYIIPNVAKQVIIQSTATHLKTTFSQIVHSDAPKIGYCPIDVVSINPWYVLPRSHKWNEDMIKIVGLKQFQREFECKFGE